MGGAAATFGKADQTNFSETDFSGNIGRSGQPDTSTVSASPGEHDGGGAEEEEAEAEKSLSENREYNI